MVELLRWNVAENREWFVKVADVSSGIGVSLYHTLADLQAGANRQAYGAAYYGSGVPVILRNGAGIAIEMLQSQYGHHVTVSGQSGDATLSLRVGRFVELPEISHSIYRDSRLIEARATAEIDAHTHADIARNIALGIHLPELEAGDIARLNSTRRGIDALGQVSGHRIVGEQNSLTSELDISFYMELKR